MTKSIVTVALDESTYERYMELTRGKKGAILQRAIRQFAEDAYQLDGDVIKRRARINAAPERSISASIPDSDKRALVEASERSQVRLAEVLRYLLFGELDRSEERADLPDRGVVLEPLRSFKPLVRSTFETARSGSGRRAELDLVKQSIEELVSRTLDERGSLPQADGYQSTGLAVIDAVFAANARYESVQNLMARIRPELTEVYGGDSTLERFDLQNLVALHDHVASLYPGTDRGDALAEHFYGNRSVVGGYRKATVVESLARCLLRASEIVSGLPEVLNGIDAFDALWRSPLRSALAEQLLEVMGTVHGVGPATSRYCLLLLGGPFVKPDVMTTRFVERVLGRTVATVEVSSLLEQAITELIDERGWPYSVPRIDHLIWKTERERPYGTKSEEENR